MPSKQRVAGSSPAAPTRLQSLSGLIDPSHNSHFGGFFGEPVRNCLNREHRIALRRHPNVGVPFQHLPRQVSHECQHRALRNACFRKLRREAVPQIVESAIDAGPGNPESGNSHAAVAANVPSLRMHTNGAFAGYPCCMSSTRRLPLWLSFGLLTSCTVETTRSSDVSQSAKADRTVTATALAQPPIELENVSLRIGMSKTEVVHSLRASSLLKVCDDGSQQVQEQALAICVKSTNTRRADLTFKENRLRSARIRLAQAESPQIQAAFLEVWRSLRKANRESCTIGATHNEDPLTLTYSLEVACGPEHFVVSTSLRESERVVLIEREHRSELEELEEIIKLLNKQKEKLPE